MNKIDAAQDINKVLLNRRLDLKCISCGINILTKETQLPLGLMWYDKSEVYYFQCFDCFLDEIVGDDTSYEKRHREDELQKVKSWTNRLGRFIRGRD